MKTLTELAEYYKTDKKKNNGTDPYVCHNYVTIYDKRFLPIKDSVKNIMEIGILRHPDTARFPYEGSSILMWNDYFENATIHGVDINDHTRMNTYGKNRIKIYITDQGNREQLKTLVEYKIGCPLDIIVDDGSHWMHHQQISLGFLFKYVKSGGVYVIEDLHSSNPSGPFGPMTFRNSMNDTRTQNMLEDFMKTGKMISQFMVESEMEYLEENIKECVIEFGDPPTSSGVAFIYKR